MYCPNCKQEYDGKFCPECGSKLIEMPITSGVSLNLGDANAISGDLHVNDSHAVHNEDKSIHNITNTTSTVNNITQVSAQKTEREILQEHKTQFLNACKRAYEDNVLNQKEIIELQELRIKLGLDEKTAEKILVEVKAWSDRNAVKSELPSVAKVKLNSLTDKLLKNEVKALMDQIDSLESYVKKYDHDELLRKYYLVLAALKPEKCIEQKERTKTDTYWEAFWCYLAYIKAGRLIDAEETLASLDHFSNYPEDNMTVLAAAGELMKGHPEEAKEYLDATTGEYTPALQRFVDSLYLLLAPQKAKKTGADENTCAFYLVNFFGQKDPKVKAEEERIRKAKAEEEAKRKAKEEEAKRKAKEAEEARKRAEEERRRLEAERKAKEEAIRKAKEAEEAKRRAEEAKRRAEVEAIRKAKEAEEADRKTKEEAIRKAKEAEEAKRRAEEEARRNAEEAERKRLEAERKAKEEAIRKAKEAEEAKRRAEEKRLRKEAEELRERKQDIAKVIASLLGLIAGTWTAFAQKEPNDSWTEPFVLGFFCGLFVTFFELYGVFSIIGIDKDGNDEKQWRTTLCRSVFVLSTIGIIVFCIIKGIISLSTTAISIYLGLFVTGCTNGISYFFSKEK